MSAGFEQGRNGTGPLPRRVRIAIVGSGFSGLGMAVRLKRDGIEDFVVLERGDEVGGTWRVNTYPGCQCDVPSHLYSFSFDLNPDWSRTYSMQPEIWEYLRGSAKRFGIAPHIRFGCEVRSATWDDAEGLWRLDTSRGELSAEVLIAGIGPLSEPRVPDVPGLEDFEGTVFHSAEWDHGHDLTGERVAVIGTGASAIQFVPKIQPTVGRLHLFQRTPPWVLPHTDRPITRIERWLYRTFPFLQRALRGAIYWARETYVLGFAFDRRLMRLPRAVGRLHLRRQVPDPELRRKLTPSYEVGCKRILLSNDYYRSLTRPNVEVLTGGVREVRGRAVIAGDGSEREVDTIILGTGFHVTDFPGAREIRGRDGRSLIEVWRGSPQAYMGTTIAGFPNLFMLLGPNTGLGHNSVVFMIEAQIAHVIRCLRAMERRGAASIEVRPGAQRAFNERIQRRMPGTVWVAGGCASWYIDENGLNTTIWPEFTWRFRREARRFEPRSYLFRRLSEREPGDSAAGARVVSDRPRPRVAAGSDGTNLFARPQ